MRLNQIQAIGRIGQDAKIIVSNERKFVAFSLAVDESYKDRNGNKVEKTVWYDCTSEQERFLKIIDWLTKGREVFVTGKPSVRTYEKDGKVYGSIRIQLDNLSLGSDGTNGQQRTATAQATAQARTTAPAAPAAAFNSSFDDDEANDLPF